MSDISELREEADLTQKQAAERLGLPVTTFGAYERGERSPSYEEGVRLREELAEAAEVSLGHSPHVVTIQMPPVAAGRGGGASGEPIEAQIDERIFEGTEISAERSDFYLLQGSGLEPLLSHGQAIGVDPCERVLGDDLYVWWCSEGEGYVAGLLSSVRGGLQLETKGPNPTSTFLRHLGEGRYRTPEGEESTVDIQGRVVGATMNPSRVLAEIQEGPREAPKARRSRARVDRDEERVV